MKISHFTPEELWESSKKVKYLTKGYTTSIDGVQANTKANVPPTHSAISLQKWCNTLPRAMDVAEIAYKKTLVLLGSSANMFAVFGNL